MSGPRLKEPGRQVRSLVEQFSDTLLAEEEKCFARIDAAFRSGVGDLPADVRSRLARVAGDPKRLKSETPLQNRILRGQQRSCEEAGEAARRLVEDSERLAYAAIGRELRVCEGTLGRRYRGLTAEAVQAAQEQGASLVDASATDFAPAATAAIGRFRTQMLAQFGRAADEREILARLFTESRVRGVRGFTSRGVWWWTPTDLKAEARAWSIKAANTARTEAMRQFNVLGAERG